MEFWPFVFAFFGGAFASWLVCISYRQRLTETLILVLIGQGVKLGLDMVTASNGVLSIVTIYLFLERLEKRELIYSTRGLDGKRSYQLDPRYKSAKEAIAANSR